MWKWRRQAAIETVSPPSPDWSFYKIGDTLSLNLSELAKANNKVFEGYPVPINHTPEGFAGFCRILSVDLARSVTLHSNEGQLVGVAMLAVRGDVGWCGGFGIAPEFRGLGLSSFLLSGLIERAKASHLEVVRLEVLEGNEPAVRTYRRGGFRVERPLSVVSAPISDVYDALRNRSCRLSTVEEIDRQEGLQTAMAMRDPVRPTWQRDLATLSLVGGLKVVQARKAGRSEAMLMYRADPSSGTVALDYCVFDDPDAAILLLERVSRIYAGTSVASRAPEIVALNEPEGSPLYNLLIDLGCRPQDRQFEMSLRLDYGASGTPLPLGN